MLERSASFSVVVLVLATLAPVSLAQPESVEGLKLTLEDIHASAALTTRGFQYAGWGERGPIIRFISRDADGGGSHLASYNFENGDRQILIDGSTLHAPDVDRLITIEEADYSPDGRNVLIYTDSERVWRYNTKGYYYIYDLAAQTLRPVAAREKGFQMFAKFSPDGESVAFVRDRDLFVVDVQTGEERRLTDDGSEGGIINGTSDWVYEEEFGLRDGWAWSPDSRYIAFVQLDESGTREYMMADLRANYPDFVRFRYPKAGEVNSEIRVGVLDVETGASRYFETHTWHAGGDSLEYIPSLGWTPEIDGKAYVWMFRLNRDQNDLDVLYGNPETTTVEVVLEEQSDTWLDVETTFGDLAGGTINYLSDGRHFVWLSERDGYRHLYLYENDGTFVSRLTEGPWNVTSFHGVDMDRGTFYFTGTKASPLERHLYEGTFHAASSSSAPALEPRQITESSGTHRVDLSRDLRYYIDEFSDARTPRIFTLHAIDGTRLAVLEDNADVRALVEEFDVPFPQFTTVEGADGDLLNAYVIKPSDFDSTRTYPMLIYVYGGPGSQTVRNMWGGDRFLWHAYLASNHDIIVASVDNRGTGGRSKEFKEATYRRLGILEARDQIAAARHFGQIDYVDADRIGIWGWSYGGYMTLMSMLLDEGPETFKLGASVAPVTTWRQYDTIYTERYMSTPQKNEQGYTITSPIHYADRLASDQKLLIVHGDLDDNVHLQNTVQMIDALQSADKQFEMMLYPGRAHGISGSRTRLHLYTMLTDFIVENL